MDRLPFCTFTRCLPFAPNEGAAVAAMEPRIGEHKGTLNSAIPSTALKAMRNWFDQQAAPPEAPGRDTELAPRQRLARHLRPDVKFSLAGARARARELLSVEPGQVPDLGMPIDLPVTALLNGQPHFQGTPQVIGSRIAVRVQ